MPQQFGNDAKVQLYKSPNAAIRSLTRGARTVLFVGDCLDLIRRIPNDSIDLTITSPPYCMGKDYERSQSVEDFIAAHKQVIPEIVRVTRPGGSICWQVGYHVAERRVYPLDFAVFSIFNQIQGITLRNRIVWTFAHGLHGATRFSGRHEVILWFTKGLDYYFDLDSVRVPQKYPGKKHYKGPHKGQLSGNPKGKNPGDVWQIPNVKSKHVEKLGHPCQFPIALAERLVRAMCPEQGIVFDPFAGSASSGVAAIISGRRFLGAEISERYTRLARTRLIQAHEGTVQFRPAERPIYVPGPTDSVAQRPAHFLETFQ